ncbi:MAG: mevalonate kinase [Coxiellaceae bacterium]|jgi:mevalonate kinase|nr:mevalonate kinase [Coxiellaceae bacterium]
MNRNHIVTACAPGKVILSGEHAVVCGKPALGLAVNRFATTSITEESGYGIWFEFLNDGLKYVSTLQELKILKTKVAKRYRKFTAGKCYIKDVIYSPLELIQYAFIYLVENLFLPVERGLKIQVELTLPVGCGMGASSAVILSLIHALVNYFDHTLTVDKYLYFGREIENLQHGRSSGLDLFLSFHGGYHFFASGNAHKRNLPNIPLVLVNTGAAETSTGECVEQIAKYLQDDVLVNSFMQVTRNMDLALQQNNVAMLADNIRKNHELLNKIGVVPWKVADFIAAIEARGNVAKVSGAGAIRGNQAGIVLVVGGREISDIVMKYGYEILPIQGEANGLRLI